MSNINPNCDGSHCRHGYKEMRQYPIGAADSSQDGGSLYLCLPCFANENMRRHLLAKQTGRPEDSLQVSWATAEVTLRFPPLRYTRSQLAWPVEAQSTNTTNVSRH